MQIRDAALSDIEAVTVIYNDVLTSSTAIYNDNPNTLDERIAWWRARTAQGFPVLVADDNGFIAGYGSFGEFRSWPGYRFTVEGTIHIHPSIRGRGIGTALLEELASRARSLGKHVMIAGVDSENEASLRFLERFGFCRAGALPEVGYKFGRYLDLMLLHYWLTPRGSAP